MFVSEDGTITGSINRALLDQVEPKTPEAKAQLDALRRDIQLGEEQAAADAQRLADAAVAQSPWLAEAPVDQRDAQGKSTGANEPAGLNRVVYTEQASTSESSSTDDAELERLRADAEKAGVTVDKRWGADRIRSEIEQANAAKAAKSGK